MNVRYLLLALILLALGEAWYRREQVGAWVEAAWWRRALVLTLLVLVVALRLLGVPSPCVEAP